MEDSIEADTGMDDAPSEEDSAEDSSELVVSLSEVDSEITVVEQEKHV